MHKVRQAFEAFDAKPTPPPASFVEFLKRYVSIQNEDGKWRRIKPWDCQVVAATTLVEHRLNVWLKARQLGMTWLGLAKALHVALNEPGVTVLLFSRRDDEAKELLHRLKGMAARLPEAMRPRVVESNDHRYRLGNGSRVLCFPTTAGDSYTARFAMIDEADLVPDLGRLLGAVKPTIDAGGSLLMLSRVDKSRSVSASPFKQTYLAAKKGASPWHPLFLPWHSRPDRTPAWYEEQRRDVVGRTGALDVLWEQYPATDKEALAPNQLDKRIQTAWLQRVDDVRPGKTCDIPCVRIWDAPTGERRYLIGADPAEGNPNSDDSAACVIDADTGEQVATIQGKIEPTTFASIIELVAAMYHNAPAMVERNNHGHAVIASLKERDVRVLCGHDGKPGWLSSQKGKALLYSAAADCVRDEEVKIRCAETFAQLASIEGGTLRAPEDDHDDLADAFALACVALSDPSVVRRPVRVTGR